MIRWLLLAVLALALGSVAAYLLRADTGYVMITHGRWLLETSLFGFVGAVFVIICGLYYGYQLLVAGAGLPWRVRRAMERRRADLARDSFEAGMLRLMEGHWRQAEIEMVRRAADHRAAHLNYLAAAKAAQQLGASDRREHYLRLAAQGDPEARFASLLTRAELQRARGDYAEARDSALELREQDPRHPYPLELLAECHLALGDWESLGTVLQQPETTASLSPLRLRELASETLHHRLRAAVQAANLDQLKTLWEQAGRDLREDPALLREYARGLARLNAAAEALSVIAAALGRAWDAELMRLYGSLEAADPLGQLATIEQWLGRYGEYPEAQLAAGQVCLRNKLWGKARSYLEAAVRQQPTPIAYLELARVCEATQQRAEAEKYTRMGLELAASL
ncbi:heme biosynthesis HemY N-terminal domain-containing protein [Solimonas sp. SE-A11]|uniref:heme biosynthesis HemY N-terminal domain-containing protein n=1 Tax=Solimonas sp. SE-A11 TaxID=3054954 RepID=UPI00259D0A43|nr:heme biosynthesis HemY N-terminal domain-containing protein [Solimonas sp. SE-A11]MDM4772665.1 heme biosynthesis HemY N-terminal domain-containing protein [Solimonas sp. SE-A11]